jgi:hypothetical protein
MFDQAFTNQVGASSVNQDHIFSKMSCNFCNHPALPFQYSEFCSQSIHTSIHDSIVHDSNDTPWVIDTGATDHMICCISQYTTITVVVCKTPKC